MKLNIEFRHAKANDRGRSLIDDLVTHLKKQVTSFDPQTVFLRLMLERNATRKLYHISLSLDVPGRTLATKSERHNITEALRDSFAEIERQLDKHKATLRGDYSRKQRSRDKVRQTKIEPVPAEERSRELFLSLIDRHLTKLYNYVRREIEYHQALGELLPTEMTANDAIDAIVLKGYNDFVKESPSIEIDRWLLKHAIEYLEPEIRRLNAERKMLVHIEDDIPEILPAEEVSTLGDEILDFYQPDEDLKLEDVVPDLDVSTPEDVAQNREVQRHLNRALSSLPKAWRQAFVLHYLEGLSLPEVAKMTDSTEAQTKQFLEYARQYLRQRLVELGVGARQEKKPASRKKAARISSQ